MDWFTLFLYINLIRVSVGSFHEQYRVPTVSTDKWEAYVFNDKEYIVQNLPINWENAKILCRGSHNASLALLDTKEKSEFLAEALAESQFSIEAVWVGARRESADDPLGYRWMNGVDLRRTAADILGDSEEDGNKHYPLWLNRTRVPVPEGGADCVALERVFHDHPVFVDLHCLLERPFVCERDALEEVAVKQLSVVRCRSEKYHLYDGRLNWYQAAAHCVLNKMSLASIGTMRCLRKLGRTMLKTRPSIENAWIGARGALGRWSWLDSGLSIFQQPANCDAAPDSWPPMRDRSNVKQSGCLQLDRHAAHAPVFMEARCERKMRFICYEGVQAMSSTSSPNDDTYSYVVVRQRLYWQHAADHCLQMGGALARVDSASDLTRLLLAMAEDREPIRHIWIAGRLNMTKDSTDSVAYTWYNPSTGKRIFDPKNYDPALYMPPWLDEEFSMDNSCLNLDRQDHLKGLLYGLPCDTPQYFICMIVKAQRTVVSENITDAYESS